MNSKPHRQLAGLVLVALAGLGALAVVAVHRRSPTTARPSSRRQDSPPAPRHAPARTDEAPRRVPAPVTLPPSVARPAPPETAERPRRDAPPVGTVPVDPVATVALLRALAEEHLRDEENDAARGAAERCLVIDANDAVCASVLRSALLREGHFDEARPLVEACLGVRPDDVQCLTSAVTIHVRRREFDLAERYVLRLLAAPDAAHWPDLARAQLAEARNERPVALAAYERACRAGQEFACRRANALTATRW